jgi:hypothetical protein
MIEPWYVTGFCDGEAAFTFSRSGGSYGMYFAIRQREDNAQVIEEIYKYFNCTGYLYHAKERSPTKNSGMTQPSIYYRVTKNDELDVILKHFDKYPLQSIKKREAYIVWREMVLYKKEHYRDIDYNTLRKLADALSQLNSKSRAYKRHKV